MFERENCKNTMRQKRNLELRHKKGEHMNCIKYIRKQQKF